jgi:hypothetical protein
MYQYFYCQRVVEFIQVMITFINEIRAPDQVLLTVKHQYHHHHHHHHHRHHHHNNKNTFALRQICIHRNRIRGHDQMLMTS